MDTNTLTQISADIKEAMKARDDARKIVLKSLKAALDKERIDNGKPLDDASMLAVLRQQHKQRIEAAQIYSKHGNTTKADVENTEAKLIATYLPKQLDAEEIAKHVDVVIEQTQAQTPADTGKVMGGLAKVLTGRADMKEVAALVRTKLNA